MLPKVKVFKYHAVLFMSKGKMECEIKRQGRGSVGSDSGTAPDNLGGKGAHKMLVVTGGMRFLHMVSGLSL